MGKVSVALGTVLGAVAGFVTGILVAPKSGKETRQDIKKGALQAKDASFEKAGDMAEKASQVAADVAEKAKGVVGDVGAKADEIKGRVEQAVDGAQKGFAKNPKQTNTKK